MPKSILTIGGPGDVKFDYDDKGCVGTSGNVRINLENKECRCQSQL